jgi:hypothetical protein
VDDAADVLCIKPAIPKWAGTVLGSFKYHWYHHAISGDGLGRVVSVQRAEESNRRKEI